LGLPNRSPADPAPKDRTSENERQVILTGYPSCPHRVSLCPRVFCGLRARRPGNGEPDNASHEVSCPFSDISYERHSLFRENHRPQPFSDSRRIEHPKASLPCFMQTPPMGFKESRRKPPELCLITEFKRSTCDKKPRGTKLPCPMLHDKAPAHHPSPAISSHHPAPEGMELGRKVAAETAALDRSRSTTEAALLQTRENFAGAPAQLPKQPYLCGYTSSTAEAASPVQCTSATPKRVARAVARDIRRNVRPKHRPSPKPKPWKVRTRSPLHPTNLLSHSPSNSASRDEGRRTQNAVITGKETCAGEFKENRRPNHPQRSDNLAT
jgi:hypothetical protein